MTTRLPTSRPSRTARRPSRCVTDHYDERIGVIDEWMAEFGDFPEELTANNDQIINESLDVMRSVI